MSVSMNEAKAMAKKNLAEAVGVQFEAPTGAIGVIIAEPSARGKVQAELSCTEPGCTEIHTREISDWHQCGKCRTHSKGKSRSGGSSAGAVSTAIGRKLKILDSDSEETRQMKDEYNALQEKLAEQEKAERDALRAQKAEERKAQVEAERQKREEEKAAKHAEEVRQRLELIKAEAAKRGLGVSRRTLEEAGEAV